LNRRPKKKGAAWLETTAKGAAAVLKRKRQSYPNMKKIWWGGNLALMNKKRMWVTDSG